MVVKDVTVQNVYLRGIEYYIDPNVGGTGTADFESDTVNNVQGDPDNSIAIFINGGSGTIANNIISYSPNAISDNWSYGTDIYGNTITYSGNGIDSSNSGDAADSIYDNNVSLGVSYPGNVPSGSSGIFVFDPYKTVPVYSNTISGVDTGLAVYGGEGGSAAFSDNDVTVNAGGTGALVTTDTLGYGQLDVSASFSGDSFGGGATGILVQQNFDAVPFPGNPSIPTAAVSIGGVTILDATTGIDIEGGSVRMISGSISGGTTGLEIDNSTTFYDYDLGTPASVTEATTSTIVGNTFGNLAFAGQSGNYITLADGTLGGTVSPTSFNGTILDASGVSFDGQLGASLTTASGPLTAYNVEDKITDYLDDPTLGYVSLNSNNVYVAQSSELPAQGTAGAIQRGINVAPSGGTVDVQAGSFVVNATIPKGLTVIGAGQASTIVYPAVSDPFDEDIASAVFSDRCQ